MQQFRPLESYHLDASWITIGSFDGVHRGHQALIGPLVEGARAAGVPAVAVTFYPHPAVVLRNLEGPYYLTNPKERITLLKSLGIDEVVTITFDRALASLSAMDFMQRLKTHLNLKALFVGSNFTLGRNREGSVDRLQEIGRDLGYTVNVVDHVLEDGQVVSSSEVRQALQAGNVTRAADLLGRRYRVPGVVVHGDARGHTIGLPTANLDVWKRRILPANGVYATWVCLEGQRLPSVTNVGVRPTFENQPETPQIEAHLLDFDRDLYGQEIEVEFVEYLRPEEWFPSAEAMMVVVRKDIERSREVFTHAL